MISHQLKTSGTGFKLMTTSIDLNKKGIITFSANDLSETHAVGEALGSRLTDRTIITLTGDLGSGKTSFVQGLAKGFKVPDTYYVTSPTYNIINEYPGNLTLYHIDLYRINDPEELYDIGFEEILEEKAVIAIEWPDKLPDGFIRADIDIRITITENDSRQFSLNIL